MTNPSQMEKYLTRALAYGAFALIASQLNEKISIKNGCVYSVLTSTVVSVGQQGLVADQTNVKKIFVSTAAATALLTFIISTNGASLGTGQMGKSLQLNLADTQLFQLAATTVLGEALTLYLLKPQRDYPIENCSEEVRAIIQDTPRYTDYRMAGTNVKAMNFSLRPANLFFEQLGLETTMPGGGLFKFTTAPDVAVQKIRERPDDDVIEVTAVGKRCRLARREVNMEDYFGDGSYKMSMEEVREIMDSQKIHVSPMIPKEFYLALKKELSTQEIIVLPGNDRVPMTLGECPALQTFLEGARLNPSTYGFKESGVSLDALCNYTLYQIGSMIVKTEKYHCFVGEDYRMVNREVGEKDDLLLINACGIRGFHSAKNNEIPGNADHVLDRLIMRDTYSTIFNAIGDGGIYALPAVGLGVWAGDPEVYWGAFFDAVVNTDVNLESIIVCPKHRRTPGTNKDGQEFGQLLADYKEQHPENQNLQRVVDLYHQETDVVLLAKKLKQRYPDRVVALQNASDPDVTLGGHVGEYVNNLRHPGTTEENYSAIGTNCLNVESHTGVLDDESRVIG